MKSAGLFAAMATGMVSVALVLLVGAVEPAAEIDCRGVTATVARSTTSAGSGPASHDPTTSPEWNPWWPRHQGASGPTGRSAPGEPTSGVPTSGVPTSGLVTSGLVTSGLVTSSAEPTEVTGAGIPAECGSSVTRTAGASP